ncbi:unnamed protein product, partial [Mesorhabditis belari]|uniref:XK-related protein n=1 Tax=Mesorhabditis belari TaxID=2138241 RepID=A0AAF3FPJ7_9BILA
MVEIGERTKEARFIAQYTQLFKYGFNSIVTYLSDFVSDCAVAYLHFAQGRLWSGIFILAPCLFCSIALNLVTLGFMFDDEMRSQMRSQSGRSQKSICRKSFLFKVFACIFQLGPILYYIRALIEGVRFRKEKNAKEARKHFCKMIESERDATLLRFFEAFLESVPQLLVQGTILAQFFASKPVDGELPKWVYVQIVSLLLSLSSACWSISIQHRSLRLCRPDKVNMHPHESVLQFIWRVFTVLSRFTILVLSFLAFGFWMIGFFGVHFVVSLLHITALQSVKAPFTSIEMGLIGVNAFIHLSTPFNMADGRTRRQYTIAYFVEAVEGAILAFLLLRDDSFNFPWKFECLLSSGVFFIIGISVMFFYYGCCHPNRRRHLRIDCDDVDQGKAPEIVDLSQNRVNVSDQVVEFQEIVQKPKKSEPISAIPEAVVSPMPRS